MPHSSTSTIRHKVALSGLIFILLTATVPPFAQGAPEMVALVNGAIIYRSDLESALMRHYDPSGFPTAAAQADTDLDDPQGVRQMLLENLIDRELLLQEAQRRELSISNARVLRRIENLPEHLRPKTTPVGEGGDAGADSAGAGKEGALFRYVHEGMLIERLLEMELPQIGAVSEKRARAFYDANRHLFTYPEEVHLRHILITTAPDMTIAERQKAYLRIQAVEQKLAEGAHFTSLAIDHSQCPSRARGGDLGYLTREQLYPSLAEVAIDLDPGQVSRIVESPAGYHLLLISDRRPARQLPFLQVREGLQKWLRDQQQQKAARSVIRGLREQATIERLLN